LGYATAADVIELKGRVACELSRLVKGAFEYQALKGVKKNLHCYGKLMLNCWKYSLNPSSFNFNKWKESFRVQNIGNEYHLFSLLKFPRAAILNFYEVKWFHNCFKQKEVAF